MASDSMKPAAEPDRIRLQDAEARRYWMGRLGLGEDELRAIVARIGDDPAAVEDYVRGTSSAH